MSEDSQEIRAETEAKAVLAQHYVKSNFFRVVHADGVFGGPTFTTRTIQIGIFSERFPFPKRTSQSVKENKEIMEERVIEEGIERELEVSLVMNLSVAKSFSN